MRIAAPVIGFVIEAIQNTVSGVIGRFSVTSAKPVLSTCRSCSLPATTVTAPAISPRVIISCIAAPIPGSTGSSATERLIRGKRVAATMLAGRGSFMGGV
jgi:hypothetical protein